MQKVFSLDPSSHSEVESLQFLLNNGYEVKFITASHVSITGKVNSSFLESKEGRIVYILEKIEAKPSKKLDSLETVNTYKITLYQKIQIHSKDYPVFVFHKGDNNCENIKVGDKIIIDEKIFTIKEIQEFQKSFGIKGDNIAVVVE